MKKSKLTDLSVAALSNRGDLADAIADFKARPAQQKMAAAVADAISNQHDLVVEAGTGIGKTFAYLVPALLSGKRTIVSTATRHLQDQIYFKDLPTVIDALDIKCKSALLKGRANYLCAERMEQAAQQGNLDSERADKIIQVEQWSYQTEDGDISSMSGIAENDELWLGLTSTAENCLRKDCKYYDDCYVFKARQKAAEVDLLVVNHALLMADMTLKEEGFADFLPQAKLIVVDEAHQLKDFAENNFTESFKSFLFKGVLREIGDLLKEENNPSAQLQKQIHSCTDSFKKFSSLFQTAGERAPIGKLQKKASFTKHYQNFITQGNELVNKLKPYKTLSEQWENCIQRIKAMLKFIEQAGIDAAQIQNSEAVDVVWFHNRQHSFEIHISPIDVSALLLEKSRQYDANWVYTSATLAVEGDFSYFLSSSGSNGDRSCKSFDSSFDYQSQAALYLPNNMPHPQDEHYTRQLLEEVSPILSMSKGNAFLLFTSYKALNEAKALLSKSKEYALLVQNEVPKMELIERFIKEDNALLLGTSSFWHGVDIKGPALRCIVIDRLPFASPSDPLIQAREAFFTGKGQNFFREHSLPEAVITLRQGVGRLIRSETDSGVVVIGDPRLTQSNYGRIFMQSLPPMKRCKDIASLAAYLQ